MTATERPAPPHDPPEGYRYVAGPSTRPDWRIVDDAEGELRRCRMRADRVPGDRLTCRAPSVAALNRGRKRWNGMEGRFERGGPSWWHYCEEHLFGQWIEATEDGPELWVWRLEELEEAPA